MNSLTELNGYVSNFTLDYTDERLANVLFDRPTPVNQTQSVDKGFTISASVGIEIVDIFSPSISNPVYTIDVSNLTGATVSWGTLPDGVTVTTISTGIYAVTGIQDKTSWDIIKSPTIDFSDDYYGSWTYTSTISYFSAEEGAQSLSWHTAVTVNNILFWTSPAQFIYELSDVSAVTGVPNLGNLDTAYPGATWSVTITPSSTLSIDTFTTTGTGGTFSVNSSTKVVTISGTRTQVNSRLNGLSITANANAVDFVLTYFVSNSVNGVTDSTLQTLISQGLAILGSVSQPSIYYNEDTAFLLTGAPEITDIPYDGTGTYVYTITPNTTSAINSISIGGSGGTAAYNPSTKVVTIQGTRSQVNSRLSYITITPATDYQQDFSFQYSVITPRTETASKIQLVLIGSYDTEVVNMNINRNYTANNGNLIFTSSIPQISDNDVTNPTYTIIFNCAQGLWNVAESSSPFVQGSLSPTNPLSVSGSKDYINSIFSKITFFPNVGISSNLTFTYTQIKNGTQQVSQSVTIIGSAGSYADSRTINFTNSQTWTPTISDVLYSQFDILLVGGGGGGGSYQGGGGGAGGYAVHKNQLFSNQIYDVVIGAGGAGGGLTQGTLVGGFYTGYAASAGQPSYFGNLTAPGGAGGKGRPNNGLSGAVNGATSGNGFTGGSSNYYGSGPYSYFGGGGGGSFGTGTSATGNLPPTRTFGGPGFGGIGNYAVSNFEGFSLTFGFGGNGGTTDNSDRGGSTAPYIDYIDNGGTSSRAATTGSIQGSSVGHGGGGGSISPYAQGASGGPGRVILKIYSR